MKAIKVGVIYGKHSNDVQYEYRGVTYDVEFANDISYCVTSARIQHEDAQRRIDKMLDDKSRTLESFETGLEMFWESVGL